MEGTLSRGRILSCTQAFLPCMQDRFAWAAITGVETQLLDLRNKRDALNLGMWDKVKRIRSGVKSIYGDDSSQFEMVGGTRLSDRKTPTRRAPSTPAE